MKGSRSAVSTSGLVAAGAASLMLASSVALAAPDAARAAAPDAGKLLREVEARYAGVKCLSASFTQSYRSAALGQNVVERGRIFVKRPGRMRWDYRQPEKKVFVVAPDGTTLTYLPSDFTAFRSRIPEGAPHLKLLLGESDLQGAFDVQAVELKNPRNARAVALKLEPRSAVEGVELLYLEVDPATRSVERILVVDSLGNESELILERVREDLVLKDQDFDVRLPSGIDVREVATVGSR